MTPRRLARRARSQRDHSTQGCPGTRNSTDSQNKGADTVLLGGSNGNAGGLRSGDAADLRRFRSGGPNRMLRLLGWGILILTLTLNWWHGLLCPAGIRRLGGAFLLLTAFRALQWQQGRTGAVREVPGRSQARLCRNIVTVTVLLRWLALR